MRWLTPTAHPVISIGVGSQATSIITQANAAAALHNPKGYLDSVAGGRGSVRATGWAADPDLPSYPVQVDVYIDGRMRGRFSTGVARPDVAAAMRVGPNQGFAFTVGSVARGPAHRLRLRAEPAAGHRQSEAGLPNGHRQLRYRSKPLLRAVATLTLSC